MELEKDLQGAVVEVLWDDASYEFHPADVMEMSDEWLVLTWGRVVRITKKSIFIAGECFLDNGNEPDRAVTRIPLSYIQGLRILARGFVEAELSTPEGLSFCADCTHGEDETCFCECHGDTTSCYPTTETM